ncbi:MAG: hypothetical protein U0Y10_21750 [Spirosomataceae bacterium]
MKRHDIFFRLIAIIFLLIGGFTAHSQQLQGISIQVILPPPYSPRIADYNGGDASKLTLLITNGTGNTVRIKLAGELKGRNNGIRAYTKAGFQPLTPIIVEPRATVTINSANADQGYFDKNNVEYEGIDEATKAQAAATGLIPQGNYDLCIYALPFDQAIAIENNTPKGCIGIPISYIEPPRLIAPMCNNRVFVPDNIQFVWTPPVGNIIGAQLEYDLFIVKVPDGQNPNDAIDNAINRNVGNPFVVKDLATPTYNYSQADPKLDDGNYVWRVVARDSRPDDQKIYFQNDGKSEFCTFRIGEAPVDVREVSGTTKCKDAPPVGDKLAVATNPVGQTIKLGKFDLTVTNAIRRATGTWSGKGKIAWNSVPIKVIFSGLTFNASNQAITGYAEADTEFPGLPSVDYQNINAFEAISPDFYKNYANYIKTKLLNDLKAALAVPLPIGYDAGAGLIGINYMKFSTEGADMGILLNVELPEANSYLSMAAIDICMAPDKKIPNNANVFLVKDLKVPSLPITFKKSNYPTPNGTFAEISPERVERVHGVMELNLGSDFLKLVNDQGDVQPGDVKATLTADFIRWADWIASVTLPDFTLSVLPGFNLRGVEISYDHSDLANPAGFAAPDEYKGDKGITFNGLFIKKLDVLLPKTFSGGAGRLSFSAQQVIINGDGFTGRLKPVTNPLLDYTKGSMGNWGFSIDDFEVLIVENGFVRGSMNGQLQFPISDDRLDYTCTLRDKFDDIQFVVKPKTGGYKVPLFIAQMHLYNNSQFLVGLKNGDAQLDLRLFGDVIVNAPAPLSLVLPNLYFENFAVSNQPRPGAVGEAAASVYLNPGNWKLVGGIFKDDAGKGGGWPDEDGDGFTTMPADGESGGTLAGFPIEILPPKFVANSNGIGLELGIKVNVGGDDKSIVGAAGAVQVLGTITLNGGRPKPVFKGVYPTGLTIEGDIGPAKVKGALRVYIDNPQYGTGFNGWAQVTVPGVAQVDAELMFGKTSFFYAYIDASVIINPGIIIAPPSPLTLNGFGGGFYFNMRMDGKPAEAINNNPVSKVNIPDPGVTKSGLKYVPQQGSWGIKARVFFGLVDTHMMISSLEMEAGFNGGALTLVRFNGKASIINTTGMPGDPLAMVNAELEMRYTPPATFDIALDITAKPNPVSSVIIPFRAHFDPDRWRMSLGDPYGKRMEYKYLDIDIPLVKIWLGVSGYVAMGNDMPGMPPLPQQIADFMGGEFGTSSSAADAQRTSQFERTRNPIPALVAGANFQPVPVPPSFGILLGAQLNGGIEVKIAVLALRAQAMIGFDASLLSNQRCDDGTTPVGFNGWYAKAQFYAYVKGGVDIDVDAWFASGTFRLCSVEAGAVLQGGAPDPAWAAGRVRATGSLFGGLLKVNTGFQFAFGKKCDPKFAGDPLAGLQIISELRPVGNAVKTNNPLVAVFNVPMNTLFDIEIPDGSVRTYKFMLEDWSLFYKDKKNGNRDTRFTAFRQTSWVNDNQQFIVEKSEHFASETQHTFYVRVVIREIVNGSETDPYIDKIKRRERRIEERTSVFTSGKQPDYIPIKDVQYTWPIDAQRYFFKSQLSQGFVLGQIPPELFDQPTSSGSSSNIGNLTKGRYIFEAWWVPEDGSETIKTKIAPYAKGSGIVKFDIPSQLQNQKVYRVELHKIFQSGLSVSLAGMQYINAFASAKVSATGNYLYSKAASDYFYVQKNTLGEVKDDDDDEGKVIFDIAFRTSKHNTFQEKMAALKFQTADYKNTTNASASDYLVFDLKPDGDQENFEDSELFGHKPYNQQLPPTVEVNSPVIRGEGGGMDDYIYKNVYDYVASWRWRRMSASLGYTNWRQEMILTNLPQNAVEKGRQFSGLLTSVNLLNTATFTGASQSSYSAGSLVLSSNAAVYMGGSSSSQKINSIGIVNMAAFNYRLFSFNVNDEPSRMYYFSYKRDFLSYHDFWGVREFGKQLFLTRAGMQRIWGGGWRDLGGWLSYVYRGNPISATSKSISFYTTWGDFADYMPDNLVDPFGNYGAADYYKFMTRPAGSTGSIDLTYTPYPGAPKVTVRKTFQVGTKAIIFPVSNRYFKF